MLICFKKGRSSVSFPFRALTLITPDKRQLRAGRWELPAGMPKRAICILLNGHTEFLEKYHEAANELCARGFEVVSLDWRGQGASERSVYGNRAGHVANFEEYDADLAALLQQAVEPIQRAMPAPLPLIGLAHSMGAHILLRFLHEHKRQRASLNVSVRNFAVQFHFACAILVAPMIEINTGRYSHTSAALLTSMINLRKPSKRFVFGIEGRDPLELKFEDNAVTSDRARFERTRSLLRAQPFLRINGPTFGWLGAAFRSMRRMQRKGFAEEIATPLLVFGAGRDRVVRTEAVRAFARKLSNGRYVEIEDARHEILMESDSIRTRFWAEFDAFVDEQLSISKPDSAGLR